MSYDSEVTKGLTIGIGAGDAVDTAPGDDTFTTIGDLTNFSGPGGSRSAIDVTDFDSEAIEKLAGLIDEGQLTVDVNYVPGDTGQAAAQTARDSGQLRNIQITYPGGAVHDIKGFVASIAPGGAVNDKVTASITLELSGKRAVTAA
ncbi:phage tail tube protein [Euryhalocaulis caribicus]|uniref:phage tail tube protein n=1 Tax=Euryhalocaulis caribicus TaxID=1161401 RepID=UPI0003AAD761|nr:phage tail tube protein [Euryhalocaulis caribicus]